MPNNMTDSARKAAEIKAQKRAAALRENLKRRKQSEQAREGKGEQDAKSQDRE